MTAGRYLDLTTLTLASGGHQDAESGMCVMEAVSYIAGEPFSDHPKCASRVLTTFAIRLNDGLPHDHRQELIPLIPRIVGTADDGQDRARAYLAVDWQVRECTPMFLDLHPDLAAVAADLRGLARIVDEETATAARPVVRRARDAARDSRRAALAAVDVAAAVDADVAVAAAVDADVAVAVAVDAAVAVAVAVAVDAAVAVAAAAAVDAAVAVAADRYTLIYRAAYDAAMRAVRPTVDRARTAQIALLSAMINPSAAGAR